MADPNTEGRDLSQGEIDALLNKITVEGLEQEHSRDSRWAGAKRYDFRRPDKLSKDQMRTLQLLHESFARVASSSLSAYLRTAVQLNLVSIEQGVYEEFVAGLPSDTLLHILTMEPLPGNLLMGIDLGAAMTAVDRLLGGTGVVVRLPQAPTEIELALIQALISNMLRGMREAWSRMAELQPAVRDVVLDPRFVQIALKSDPVVVIAFEMGILHRSGTLTICLPYVVLEPVLPKLTAQLWFASARRLSGTHQEQLRRNLDAVAVEVMVELGAAKVTLQDLGHLKVGDVLPLNQTADQPMGLLVGRRRKLLARPGLIGNRLAVQVVGWADELESAEEPVAAVTTGSGRNGGRGG